MLNFDCGIYTITSPSGRQYVGSARSFRARWHKHLRDLRRGQHHCAPLQRAYQKYGEGALRFAKVAFVPISDLLRREQEQIDARDPARLYNTSPTAGSRLGDRATPQALANMRRAKLAQTPETRAKIGAAHRALGTKPSREAVLKGVAARLAKGVSAEQRAKLSAIMRGYDFGPEHGVKIRAAKANKSHSGNTSGYCGVHQHEGGKWMARYNDNGRRVYLGLFDSPEAANDAIIAARSAKKA